MPIIKRPLTDEQKRKLSEREKPSQEDINAASDDLFMYLIEKINRLEEKGGD